SAPDGRFPLASHVVGETHAGPKLHIGRIAAAAGAAWIAFIEVTLRRIGKALRDQPWTVAFGAADRVAIRMERIPAKPQIEHEAGVDTVIVLDEQTSQSAAPARILTAALNKPVHGA